MGPTDTCSRNQLSVEREERALETGRLRAISKSHFLWNTTIPEESVGLNLQAIAIVHPIYPRASPPAQPPTSPWLPDSHLIHIPGCVPENLKKE